MNKSLIGLRYGGRKSAKLVRCYWKEEINAYRVELELHPGVLDKSKIEGVQDLPKAARTMYPKHVRFAKVDFKRLRIFLMRTRPRNWEAILEGAVKRTNSMRRITQYLRRQGIPNVHRFLPSLSINEEVHQALKTWAYQFEEEYEQETHHRPKRVDQD